MKQITFDFANKTSADIAKILAKHNIILTVDEALTIQKELLQRPPSLTECVLWSIQSSEHCSYKSSRQYLKKLPTNGPDVILGAKEDAGIIAVAKDNQGNRYGVAISHESHNHPSQIVPFEGAATGVGGNVRDVCCMGAEVIAISDSLRFGDIKNHKTQLIHDGVVAGIASYGNSLGIPNIGGDLYYDPGYNDNCLVTVVTLGVVREDEIIHSFAPKDADGYNIILVGKATDNSGFAGASFASIELEEEKKEQNRGAVQEPNAFLERHLLKASYQLFEILKEKQQIDKVGFKDLGAGGIACASVELADAGGYGAVINLDEVPTNMTGLHPSVILCSETQERFMWVASAELTELILNHYNEKFALPNIAENAQAKVIGKIIAGGDYIVRYQGTEIVNAKAAAITRGLSYDRPTARKEQNFYEPKISPPKNYNYTLLKILSNENIASRAPIFETYDKQVQGRTIIEAGTADAGLLQPFNSENFPAEIRQTGIALSSDQNPRYCRIDPYWGAINAVAEAIRNVAATGAEPIAITDCLCFGNPEKPHQMAEFVAAIQGLSDVCNTLELPIIAGNVSLYNESQNESIPPSPIISCLGKCEYIHKAITPSLKATDSILIMVGERLDECGGSIYYSLYNELGSYIPKPNFATLGAQVTALLEAIDLKLLLAAHDISDGGIAIALAEMTFRNNIGIEVAIPGKPAEEKKLFSETGGFVLEVSKNNFKNLQNVFNKHGTEIFTIGKTTEEPILEIGPHIKLTISEAKKAWENGLREKIL